MVPPNSLYTQSALCVCPHVVHQFFAMLPAASAISLAATLRKAVIKHIPLKFGRAAQTPERRAWPSERHRPTLADRAAPPQTRRSTAKPRDTTLAPCAHPPRPPPAGAVRGRGAPHARLRRRLRGVADGTAPERLPKPNGRRPSRRVEAPQGPDREPAVDLSAALERSSAWVCHGPYAERRVGGLVTSRVYAQTLSQ